VGVRVRLGRYQRRGVELVGFWGWWVRYSYVVGRCFFSVVGSVFIVVVCGFLPVVGWPVFLWPEGGWQGVAIGKYVFHSIVA